MDNNNITGKIESAMSLINKLSRTIIFDGAQFSVINPDEEYSDWEHTEDGKVKKVFSTTSQNQSVTEFFYNNSGDLEKMVTTVDGKEKGVRTFSYDDKGRCIEEDAPYEIIVRTYDDENGTYKMETRDIEQETVKVEEFSKYDNAAVLNDICKNIPEGGELYRKTSEVVYKVGDDETPLFKQLWEYDDENNTFRIKEFTKNPNTNFIQISSDSTYRTDCDATLEMNTYYPNKEGIIEERRIVNTWNDKFDKLIHSDFFIDNKLDGAIDHKYTIEGDVETEEITGGSTISRYKDDQEIFYEDSTIIVDGELYAHNFKVTKDGISVYNMVPATPNLSKSIEVQSDDINVLFVNDQLKYIKFTLNDREYEYSLTQNDINCYAKVEIHDGDLLQHQDEVYFKIKPNGTDDIVKYILKKFKEYVLTNETLKLLLSKGGFDYEKIGEDSD